MGGLYMNRDHLLNRIKDEQERAGYVSEAAMVEMAKGAGVSVGEVYGVTTFYSFLSTKPLGRHVIRICKSVPCYFQNGDTVASAIEKQLGIHDLSQFTPEVNG